MKVAVINSSRDFFKYYNLCRTNRRHKTAEPGAETRHRVAEHRQDVTTGGRGSG